jgi:hypothetical protein
MFGVIMQYAQCQPMGRASTCTILSNPLFDSPHEVLLLAISWFIYPSFLSGVT